MSDVRISYETLFDILRREKNREELQELSPGFYYDVLEYLKEKHSILENAAKSDSIFAGKEKDSVRIQLENVRKILRELHERRENKLIRIAQDKARTGLDIGASGILPEERQFFDSLADLFRNTRASTLTNLLNLKNPETGQAPAKPDKLEDKQQDRQNLPKQDNKSVPEQDKQGIQDAESYSFAPGTAEANTEALQQARTIRFLSPLPRFMGPKLEIYGPYDEDEVASLPERIAELLIKKGRAEEIKQV